MANPFQQASERMNAKPKTSGRNAWNASSFNRLSSGDWTMASSRSADGELRYELRTLRNRSRELVRNSPFGVRYQQLIAENVVGPTGFQLCAKNLLKDGKDFHETANASIEGSFAEWARPDNCDVTHKLSFTELLSLGAAGWGTDGEILIRILRGPRFGPFGIQLQVLDVDYLDDQLNQQRIGDGPDASPAISQGVELDEYGAPVAYHLWTRHPYDMQGRFVTPTMTDRIRVPAADIIHAFIPLRAGQSRGVPHAAAIMTTLKMLDGYIEAELVAARIASATMGAIEDLPNGDGPAPNPNVGGTGDGSVGGQEIPAEVEPGAMLDLRGKGKLALWDPQHPTSAFPDFTRMMSHFAAMGIGISYGTLTGDLSQANYGSLRVGMLDERDHWERLQGFMITHVIERVYREWLKMALLNSMIPGIVDRDATRWQRVEWQPRGFDWIDPVKDVQGDLLEVAAGTFTLTRMAAKRGRDLEKMVEERAREIALFKRLGVTSTLATTISDRPANENDPGDTSGASTDKTTSKTTGGKGFTDALPVAPFRPRLAAEA